ncbi:biopolymer transport protein TolQ [Parvibaculum indicum]|uniref:protein TolQ n=1 Tax=Parvibaculum indicum TaxID=562969 RepID=UPI00141DD8A5|nr:protein TolQ [Parvibaculum indicum]NIJ40467.1 biopolymer transport protein TolQ [Parvibaculum indicum]
MDPATATNVIANAGVDAVPVDFSVWGLFMRADVIVKIVMLGLLFASVWSWAIIFDKWWRFGRVERRADQFERIFWSGRSLDDLYQEMGHRPEHPLSTLFIAAMREWRRSKDIATDSFVGLKERVDKVMQVTINREVSALESRLLFLATVGSVAPFVGLFGTVWGIMNSFQSIAISRDTNLAVVAPGIAEALFATALGLLAAIPAVVAYNRFSNQVGRIAGRMETFADEFSAILSRQLDERG